MPSKLYKYITLVAAKLVGRRHPKDIQPPGMKELLNAFISRSDSAITCRPDFDPISESLLSVRPTFEWASLEDDYLNSAAGLYGTTDNVWFSRLSPITWDGTSSSIACSTYSTGTVTASSGQKTITGSGTAWRQNVWVGCFISLSGSGAEKYYQIDGINSDTEITVTDDLTDAESGAAYNIYRPHQLDFANYKLNIQPFTTGIIYSCPSLGMPIDSKKICGPFYASVVETSVDDVFVELTDDDVNVDDELQTSNATMSQNVATDGTNWMCVAGENGGDEIICKSTDPSDDWEAVSLPNGGDFSSSGFIVSYNGYFYLAGKNTSTNKAAYAVTTNVGTSWTVVDHDSNTGLATSVAVSAAGRVLITCASGMPNGTVAYYTDDGGTTWEDATHASYPSTSISPFFIWYDNATFVGIKAIGSIYFCWQSSAGDTFETGASAIRTGLEFEQGAYSPSGDYWIFAGTDNFNYWKVAGDFSYDSIISGDYDVTGLIWAGDKFMFGHGAGGYEIYSTTNFVDFDEEYENTFSRRYAGAAYSNRTGESVFSVRPATGASVGAKFCIGGQTQAVTEWRAASFEPLSEIYRSLTHSVLNGYVMLLGTREYQSTNSKWEYYPRRIRWTVPLTYNDFSGTGSGTADLDGSGAILDSRTVNGRIVTFESSSIGAISPRGYSSDPWEYDRIKDNIRTISNPVVVDDVCYFIDDSGLLRQTNGVSVEAPPFSFDLTEYDDFNADKPIWLTYSPEFEALAIYNPSGSGRYVYMVEPESGGVTRFQASEVDSTSPKSIVCVENSDDRRMMITYNPISADTDELVCAELSTGSTITGKDEWTSEASDDTYHYTEFETPEIYLVPEGAKTSIKHILIRTYTDGTTLATNPTITVLVKSLEDTQWHSAGDTNGTITVTDSACSGTSTAWSNTLGAAGSTVYNTPCLATQARVYVGSSLQTAGTDYTITDTKEITFGSNTGDTVYAYWENVPEVKVAAGDMINTTDGWHRITAVTDQDTMTLDHYLASGSDATATHHPAERIPVGDGEVKIGMNKLVEGVKIKVVVMHDASGDATVTKVTGITVGHVPCGDKKVEV